MFRPRRYFPTILIVLLAVFNDGAMIALSKDRVIASPVPNHWDLKSIFIVGESLLLLHSAINPGQALHTAPSSWSCKGGFMMTRCHCETITVAFIVDTGP